MSERSPNGTITRKEFYEAMTESMLARAEMERRIIERVDAHAAVFRNKREDDIRLLDQKVQAATKELEAKVDKNTNRYYSLRNWGSVMGTLATIIASVLGISR